MRPNPLIVRAYTVRGAYLWLSIRSLGSMLILLVGSNPLHLSLAVHLNFVLLSVALCFLDTRIHRERALLGNLAVSSPVLTAFFAGPAVAGELTLLFVGAIVA